MYKSIIASFIIYIILCIDVIQIQAQTPTNKMSMGINLSTPEPWSNGWTFRNIARHSYQWLMDVTAPTYTSFLPSSSLNQDNYPISGTSAILPIIWDAASPINDTFVLSWEGSANVGFYNHPQLQQTVSILDSTNQYIKFRLIDSRFLFAKVSPSNIPQSLWQRILEFFGITNPSSNYLSNIQCIQQKYINHTGSFTPEFYSLINNFSTIRFMDWLNINKNAATNWSQLRSKNYLQQSFNDAYHEVHPDYYVELCNHLNKDMWLNIPYAASDNFVQDIYANIISQLNNNLKVYVEYGNEAWNSDDRFKTYSHLNNHYQLNDSMALIAQKYGMRTAQIHQIIKNMNSINRNIINVIAWQAANPYYVDNVIQAYKSIDSNNVRPDVLAIAQFFGGYINTYNTNNQLSETGILNLLLNDDQLDTNTYSDTRLGIRNHLRDYQNKANQYGLKLMLYEMGQHLFYSATPSNNVYKSVNLNPLMKQKYREYFQLLNNYNIALGCHFSSNGKYGNYYWGLKEELNKPDSIYPKLKACKEYIAAP